MFPSDARFTWPSDPDERLYPQALSPAECAAIVAEHRTAHVTEDKLPFDNRIYRDTDVRWIKTRDAGSAWLFRRLDAVAADWNREFRFAIEGVADLQLASYRPGQNYDWHTDLGANDNTRRKLSLVLMLSPPADYEGGQLQLLRARARIRSYTLEQGTALLFPAWMKHRVLPVTSGHRWTLVAWFHGPPFR